VCVCARARAREHACTYIFKFCYNHKGVLKKCNKPSVGVNFIPSGYTLHICRRWYTSDFHEVIIDIKYLFHRGTKACLPP